MSEPVSRDPRLVAYELGQAFGAHRQLPELIGFAVATCRELLKAEGVAILLLDRENDELYFPYSAEEDPQIAAQLAHIRFPAYRGIAGKALRTARSLRVDDVSADRWFFAGVDEQTQRKTRSLVCAPLIAAHGALGVIEAVNPRSGGRFNDEDLALLDALAQVIAGAIENVAHTTAPGEESAAQRRSETAQDAPAARDHVFRQQGEYWTIIYQGETLRLRHAKGLAYIAHLLRYPGQEFHAIDLINVVEGDRGEPQPTPENTRAQAARSLGDAGAMLDSQAKQDYKRQLNELREDLEEAHAFNDPGRVEKLQQEIDVLTQELARAVGLGGRERRAGSHAERARVNVTRAITSAVQKIAEHHAGLGCYFRDTIRTGTFCSYVPDPRAPVEWALSACGRGPAAEGARPAATAMAPDETYTRRICAILFGDVTGYSALVGEDDDRTARAIEQLQSVVRAIVTEAKGYVAARAGDAIFASFDSVVAAVQAALTIQRRVSEEEFQGHRLQVRIGVHFGDVLVRDGASLGEGTGDAINIAARLEALARPGTVCVSEAVYLQVRRKFDETFIDLGRQQLKNIPYPVHAYLMVPREVAPQHVPARRRVTTRWGAAAAALVLLAVAAAVLWYAGHSAPGAKPGVGGPRSLIGVVSPGIREPAAGGSRRHALQELGR